MYILLHPNRSYLTSMLLSFFDATLEELFLIDERLQTVIVIHISA